MSNSVGRPMKFESPEQLQEKIDAYFAECDPHWIDEEYYDYPEIETEDVLESQPHGGSLKRRRNRNYDAEQILLTRKVKSKQVPYTITGLALALDTSRETLLDYQARDEYSDTIKRAKLKIHNFAEGRLFENNPTGTIFNLKNNFGWKDKTETELSNPDGSLSPYAQLSKEQLEELAKGK